MASDARAFLDTLHARGVAAMLQGNALKFRPYDLADADRAFVRANRAAIKAALRDGYAPPAPQPVQAPAPQPRPAPEPEPVVRAYGVLVTDKHVREAMTCMGDQALADYLWGRTSKAAAYEMTRRGLMQSMELRSRVQREEP